MKIWGNLGKPYFSTLHWNIIVATKELCAVDLLSGILSLERGYQKKIASFISHEVMSCISCLLVMLYVLHHTFFQECLISWSSHGIFFIWQIFLEPTQYGHRGHYAQLHHVLSRYKIPWRWSKGSNILFFHRDYIFLFMCICSSWI